MVDLRYSVLHQCRFLRHSDSNRELNSSCFGWTPARLKSTFIKLIKHNIELALVIIHHQDQLLI